jgi:hypothetical protein
MTQSQYPFFSFLNKKILTIIIISLFIISVFNLNSTVKADQISTTVTADIDNFNTNVGTTAYLNGYDAFITNNQVLFYSGNGSVLKYIWSPNISTYLSSSSNTTQITKIMAFNATAILIVTVGINFPSSSNNFGVYSWLLDTQQFTNKTWVSTTVLSNSLGSSRNGIINEDLILFFNGGNYFIYISMSGDNAYGYQSNWQYGLFKITNSGLIQLLIQQNKPSDVTDINYDNYNGTNCQGILKGASFWFTSATELNTVYIIGSQGSQYFSSTNGGSYRILKINVITPIVIFIGDYNYQYSSKSVYFVDFAYHTVGISNYYDVVFIHPALTPTYQWNMEYLRFNDTNFVNDWQLTYTDTNMFGNIGRIWSVLVPNGMWGNSLIGTLLYNGNTFQITPLYVGQLAQIFGINVYVNQTDTNTPIYYTAPSGAYLFRYGADNCYFTLSNNVGGYLSPYGYGTQFQLDFQNSKVVGDHQIALTPSTCLTIQWNIQPVSSNNPTVLLPTTYASYGLSQNTSYIINAKMLVGGIIQLNGTYSVWSNGESTISTFGRDYNIYKVINGQIDTADGHMYISIPFTNTMIDTPTYESYLVNVTINGFTYSFTFAFSWWFTDNQGIPLPVNYIGNVSGDNGNNNTGNSGGNGGGTNSIIPILTSIFGNIKTDIIFIIFGIICGLLTWKFALTGLIAGLTISAFLCTMAGLLPIWAVGLVIVLDITLIVLGSGLLNKKENVGN